MSQFDINNATVDEFSSHHDDPEVGRRSRALHNAMSRAVLDNPFPIGESGLPINVELERRQADLRLALCESQHAAGVLTDDELACARRMYEFLQLSVRERVRRGAAEIHRSVHWLDIAHPHPELAELARAVNEHHGRVIAAQRQALATL